MLKTKQQEEIIFNAVIICNGCVFFFLIFNMNDLKDLIFVLFFSYMRYII